MTCSPHLISFRGIPEGDKKIWKIFKRQCYQMLRTNIDIYHKKPTSCLSLHEFKKSDTNLSVNHFHLYFFGKECLLNVPCYQLNQDPFLTGRASNPNKFETSTRPGEILVFLPIRLIILRTQYMHIHTQGMPLQKKK